MSDSNDRIQDRSRLMEMMRRRVTFILESPVPLSLAEIVG